MEAGETWHASLRQPKLQAAYQSVATTSGVLMPFLSTSPALTLVGYCTLALLASCVGGMLPTLFRLTHTHLQVAVSFVAGLMLGLSLLGLLPHSAHELRSIHQATTWLLAGFMVMFFLQRFLPFHHHDVAEESPIEPCEHAHGLAERSARSLNWAGVTLGLSVHSVFDGLAMAASVASAGVGHSEALGLGTSLAVILHKPFGALAITTLMTASGARKSRHLVNLLFALVTPLGALLFYLGAGSWVQEHPSWLGGALAFSAGTFLCIAGSDLLPELQFHRHDRLKLSMGLVVGLAVAIAITRFAHGDHTHEHDSGPASDVPAASVAGL